MRCTITLHVWIRKDKVVLAYKIGKQWKFKRYELDELVVGFIKRRISEELLPEDIVILTSKTIENSWILADKQYGDKNLYTNMEMGKILFAKIRKFNGLEAEAILIIDKGDFLRNIATNRKV